jgi:hypothetical protein
VSLIDEWMHVEKWWNDTDRKTEVLGKKKLDPLPLCPPQNAHITNGQNYKSFKEIAIK